MTGQESFFPTLSTQKQISRLRGGGVHQQTRSLPIDRNINPITSIAIIKDPDAYQDHADHETSSNLSQSTTLPDLTASVSSLNLENPSDLESHFTSLGHTLLLKNQRDSLRNSLAASKSDAARLRALSLRLAARVVVRDRDIARRDRLLAHRLLADYLAGRKSADALERLRNSVQVYERQGTGLLNSLSGIGAEGVMPSPPFSSPRRSSEESDDGEYLPSEILEICQYRVNALLRECRLSRDTLVLLRETEEGLREEAKEQELKIEELRRSKADSDAELKALDRRISNILGELASSQKRISSLESERDSLQAIISQSDAEKIEMESEKVILDKRLQEQQQDIYTAQEKLQSALHMADLLQRSKSSLEDIVKGLEAKSGANETYLRQKQSQLTAAREQLSNLEEDFQAQARVIAALEDDLSNRQDQVNKQGRYAQAAAVAASRRELELSDDVFKARRACVEAEEQLRREHSKLQELRKDEELLRESLTQQKHAYSDLEASNQQAIKDLETTRSIHTSFLQSSENLSKELKGEKAKTLALMETEGRLKTQLSDYEQVVSRLQTRVQGLEASLASETSKSSEGADSVKAIQLQLHETMQVLADVNRAHQEHVAELLQSQAELKEALRSANSEISRLQKNLEESRKHSAVLTSAIDCLRHDLDKSRLEASEQAAAHISAIESYRTKESEHLTQIETHKSTITDRDATIQQLALQQETLSRNNSDIQNQIVIFGQDKVALNLEVSVLKSQLALREAMKKDQDLALSTQRARVEHLKAARRELQAKLRTNEKGSAHLEEQVANFKAEIESMTVKMVDSHAQMDESNRQTLELTSKIEALEQVCSSKENAIREIKAQHEIALQELQQQIETLKSKTAQGEFLVKDRDIAAQEVQERHQTELDHLNVQVSRLREQYTAHVSQSKARENDLMKNQAKYDAEIEELNGIIQTWKTNHHATLAERDSKTAKITELEEKLKERSEEADVLGISALDKAEDMRKLREELENHKSQRLSVEAALSEQSARASTLRMQLEEQTKQAIDLNVQLKTLRRSSGVHVSRISELEAKNKELKDQNETMNSRNDELESKNSSLVKKSVELEGTVRTRDRANSTFLQQFRTLQKRATDADRRVVDLEQRLKHRDDRVEELRQEANDYANQVRELEQQLRQQNESSPRHHRRISSQLRSGSPPRTPVRASSASALLMLSSSPPVSPSPVVQRHSAYSHRETSSPTDSTGRGSILRSSVGLSTSPSRQDMSMTTDHDHHVDNADLEDVDAVADSPVSHRSNTRRSAIFDQQRAHTSHSMRSLFSGSRPHTPLGFGSFRHSTAFPTRHTEEDPSSTASSPLKRRGTARSGHVLEDVDETGGEKKAWGEKHPRLWKLVHVGRGKTVHGKSSQPGREAQGVLNGHRRAVSHML